MIEPRIYRAAFIPALLAVVLTMFSLESRPRPLPQGLAADVLFDGQLAVAGAREIVATAPDRQAGTPGDRATARTVKDAFTEGGFAVTVRRFDHSGKQLVNVIGKRAGRSRREVVVVAARDAAGIPDAGSSAADTAALLELARIFEGRPSAKTLVLASIDGTTLGEIGTSKLVEDLDRPDLVDGVVVMTGFGNPVRERPLIVATSNGTERAGIGLERTLAASLRLELPRGAAAGPGAIGQFAAARVPARDRLAGRAARERLRCRSRLGRRRAARQRVDPARAARPGSPRCARARHPAHGDRARRGHDAPNTGRRPTSRSVGQVMPGWVLAVLAATLLLPALVASVDAFARARRRREHVAGWMFWIAAGVLPFLLGLGAAELLALAGAIPDPPPAPVSPDLYPLDSSAAVALGVVAVVIALAWIGFRVLVVRTDRALRDPRDHGAAVAVALVLSVTAMCVLLVNAFFALLLVPAVHLWILATLTDPPPPTRARVVMVLLGLVPLASLVLYELVMLDLGPLGGAWYLFLLVTGGQVGLVEVVLGAAVAAVLGSVLAIVRAGGPDRVAPDAPSVRGPASYAGPGSLGGTGSALRR